MFMFVETVQYLFMHLLCVHYGLIYIFRRAADGIQGPETARQALYY